MEYFLLIFEYYASKKASDLIRLLLIPSFAGVALYFLLSFNQNGQSETFLGNLITLTGILLGFTISLFAILISSNSSNIKEAKQSLIGKKVFNKDLTIFDEIMSGVAYSIVFECALLILNLISPAILSGKNQYDILFSVNVGVLLHVIIVLLRSVLSFYFAESKRKGK